MYANNFGVGWNTPIRVVGRTFAQKHLDEDIRTYLAQARAASPKVAGYWAALIPSPVAGIDENAVGVHLIVPSGPLEKDEVPDLKTANIMRVGYLPKEIAAKVAPKMAYAGVEAFYGVKLGVTISEYKPNEGKQYGDLSEGPDYIAGIPANFGMRVAVHVKSWMDAGIPNRAEWEQIVKKQEGQ